MKVDNLYIIIMKGPMIDPESWAVALALYKKYEQRCNVGVFQFNFLRGKKSAVIRFSEFQSGVKLPLISISQDKLSDEKKTIDIIRKVQKDFDTVDTVKPNYLFEGDFSEDDLDSGATIAQTLPSGSVGLYLLSHNVIVGSGVGLDLEPVMKVIKLIPGAKRIKQINFARCGTSTPAYRNFDRLDVRPYRGNEIQEDAEQIASKSVDGFFWKFSVIKLVSDLASMNLFPVVAAWSDLITTGSYSRVSNRQMIKEAVKQAGGDSKRYSGKYWCGTKDGDKYQRVTDDIRGKYKHCFKVVDGILRVHHLSRFDE